MTGRDTWPVDLQGYTALVQLWLEPGCARVGIRLQQPAPDCRGASSRPPHRPRHGGQTDKLTS